MIWSTDEFRHRVGSLLDSTGQYVFLSSYRVYADSPIIREDSPRLLDAINDPEYLTTDEYALAKARCEDLLVDSGSCNWTIVRPAVTYDAGGRFQLTVLEATAWLWRAVHHVPVPLPEAMLLKQATMTWGGDVARMITLLIGNDKAVGQSFTAATAEHIAWRDIDNAYASVVPLSVKDCPLDRFEQIWGGTYQIRYDRMYNRIIDNTKILAATGMLQEQLVGIREGLTDQLQDYVMNHSQDIPTAVGLQGKLDKLSGGVPSLAPFARQDAIPVAKYLVRRFM